MAERRLRNACLKKHLPEDSSVVIRENLKSCLSTEDIEVLVIFFGVKQSCGRILREGRRVSFWKQQEFPLKDDRRVLPLTICVLTIIPITSDSEIGTTKTDWLLLTAFYASLSEP